MIKINTMEMDIKYPIVHVERSDTKFGQSDLLILRDSPFGIVKVFLPKHYCSVFSDDDLDSINSGKVSLNLIYKGACVKTKSYILAIEK